MEQQYEDVVKKRNHNSTISTRKKCLNWLLDVKTINVKKKRDY